MNNSGIIIQNLKGNGLDFNVFPNSEVLELKLKFNNPIEDERETPGKAGDKPIFVLHNTKNYKIYSLIIGTSDGGRAGFYAIRIFIPLNYVLQNFITILNEIQSKYLVNPNSISSDSHIYNETLLRIKDNCKLTNNFIIIDNSINNNFIYYDNNNITSIETIFNSNGTNCFQKLFAFQKPNNETNIKDEISINNVVYHKYIANSTFQEIKIKGQLDLLKKIKVNGIEVNFNSDTCELVLFKKESDKVEYLLKENGVKELDSFGNEVTISREDNYFEKKQIDRDRKPKKSFFEKYGIWLIFSGIVIIIILLFVPTDDTIDNEIQQPVTDTTNLKKPDTTKVKEPISKEPKVEEIIKVAPKKEEPKAKKVVVTKPDNIEKKEKANKNTDQKIIEKKQKSDTPIDIKNKTEEEGIPKD